MSGNGFKRLLQVGTVVLGTAASFVLAACLNVKEDESETDVIDGDCEVIPADDGESMDEESGS